ncbi:MAG: peptidylprolyl isomerase, partial [Bacteroidota bacterium]
MPHFLWSIALLLFLTACGESAEKGDSKKQPDVIIETNYGNIEVKLYDDTPKHKENFIKLAKEGFYDNTTFHRVISGFMVQGGDPNTAKEDFVGQPGMGGPGYTIPNEISGKHLHKRGALAAARQGDQVNPLRESSGSQFFIVQGEQYEGREQELQMIEQHLNQARFDGFAAQLLTGEEYKDQVMEIRELSQTDTNAANEKSNVLMQEIQSKYEEEYPEPFQYTDDQKQM